MSLATKDASRGPGGAGGKSGPLGGRVAKECGGLLFAGLARAGRWTRELTSETGGLALVAARSFCAIKGMDTASFLRCTYSFGVQSVPLVIATAFLTGVVVLLLAAVYVRTYGATQLVGWAAGYATFRELGPMLIALMFSGRVGSSNAAELAAMKLTDQLDALEAMAIDPYAYLIAPRVLAMVLMLVTLTIVGNLFAIAGAALAGEVLLGVSAATFYASFASGVSVGDLLHGLLKALLFGISIGVVSCRFGLLAEEGARGVGRAVNRAVVASAVAVFMTDYLVTYLVP